MASPLNCLVTIACRTFSAAASRCAHMMARGLAANGCNVDYVVGGRGDYLGKDHEGCTDYRFFCLAGTKERRGSVLEHYWMVHRGIMANRWDIIVFYSVGIQFIPLISLARRRGLKIVYVQGDHYVPLPGMGLPNRAKLGVINAIDRYLSRRSDLNALTGTSLLFEHYRNQAPAVPIHLGYPPIDTDLFSSGDTAGFRNHYNLNNLKLLVYCGGIGSLEGVEILIRAMPQVFESHPDAHLVIAGKLGVHDHALARQIDYPALADELRISSRITFTGFIGPNTVRGLLRAADILVMPKLDHRRNAVAAPIKLTEYFAAGRPVIASTVGDIPIRFRDGVELRFCAPGDSQALAEKVIELLNSPETAQQIGANGQAYARDHFDFRSWGREILARLEKGSE